MPSWYLLWFVISWFVHSCCSIAWLVSSVFGVYHPVSILGRTSLHLPGDLMAKVRNDCVPLCVYSHLLVDSNMKVFNFYSLFNPQFWPSALETQSRWSCVGLRKQRSSTCFQCRALWPACTGWRWRRRAGMHEAQGSIQWHKGRLIF